MAVGAGAPHLLTLPVDPDAAAGFFCGDTGVDTLAFCHGLGVVVVEVTTDPYDGGWASLVFVKGLPLASVVQSSSGLA